MSHRTWAIFLAMDRMLLGICESRRHISAPFDPTSDLAALCQAPDGAVTLASSRSIPDLDRIFSSLRLACAGQHGADVRRWLGHLAQKRQPKASPCQT